MDNFVSADHPILLSYSATIQMVDQSINQSSNLFTHKPSHKIINRKVLRESNWGGAT